MRKRWIMIAAIIGIVLIGIVAAGPIMSDVETPDYKIIRAEADIEIRKYDPLIIAEVQCTNQRDGTGRRAMLNNSL